MKYIAKIMLLLAVLLTLASCQRQTTTVTIHSVPFPYDMEINKPSIPDTIKLKQ